MTETDLSIDLHMPAPEAGAAELHRGLVEAGQTLGESELRTFLLCVRDAEGRMTGGCKGEIAFRSARVSELWVDAALRGQGMGRSLLDRAERLAREEGCIRLHLETRNEGARRLYERMGYAVFGTLDNYEGAQAFYYLEKRF